MAHNDGSEVIASRDGFGVGIRDLPVAMWLLVKNPVNMLVTLGAVTEGLLTSGFATFMPKFLQNQYGLTAGAAAMLGGKSVVYFLCIHFTPVYSIHKHLSFYRPAITDQSYPPCGLYPPRCIHVM